MFAKKDRLTQSKQYDTLFKRGTWVRGKWFSLISLPQSSKGRIGFIVSKKTLRDASDRNRAKRRLRAAFRTLFQKAELEGLRRHNHIVVLIHRAIEEPTFPELLQEVERKLVTIGKTAKTQPAPKKP